MSDQLPSKSDVPSSSVMDNKNPNRFKQTKTFKWTTEIENCLLLNMRDLKPCGINKHINMLLLKERIRKELNVNVPINALWNFLGSKWDIRAADLIEGVCFDTSDEDFDLPEEFDQLIFEEEEKMKKESLNGEINKKKILNWSGKTRSKSNSMSSVDSKKGLNETIPSTLLESSRAKTNEVGSDDGPCTRRSLRTSDKLENSKSDEKNKLKDLKHLNKKSSNQSKDVEKIEKISNSRGRKSNGRNVSESSFTSDNSKQRENYKNNLTDLTISDSSSMSVTPEILKGKTSNRSVSSETFSRKSNLRISDIDPKSNLILVNASIKIDLGLPELIIERQKPGKRSSSSMEAKSKYLIQSKNEANNKGKAKIRNRVTSDLLVVQQSPDTQSLGRRSCSNKNS